jgi:hypothetical protein
MNKFEQLIEYVINDEAEKARELFHDIVVEKSRAIYEDMMDDDLDEAKDEDLDEGEEELDEAAEEELDENEVLGGDQSDDLIDDIETEEEGISMEGEEEVEFGAEEEGGEEGLEDRVVDLEDKLDELMAEFEALMGDEAGEEHVDGEELGDVSADDFGGDMSGEEEVDDTEFETEGMMENVSLKAVAKPSNTEEANNKKSVVAANSGARGAMAKPVHTGASEGGKHDSAAYKNTSKDLIGKVGNSPAQSTQKPTPATKPTLAQAGGVNTKSVIQ